jgi:hypothetical protein
MFFDEGKSHLLNPAKNTAVGSTGQRNDAAQLINGC